MLCLVVFSLSVVRTIGRTKAFLMLWADNPARKIPEL